MEILNLFGEQDWDDENDGEGFRHRATAIGSRPPALGPFRCNGERSRLEVTA
jgi:hypothetical protein